MKKYFFMNNQVLTQVSHIKKEKDGFYRVAPAKTKLQYYVKNKSRTFPVELFNPPDPPLQNNALSKPLN